MSIEEDKRAFPNTVDPTFVGLSISDKANGNNGFTAPSVTCILRPLLDIDWQKLKAIRLQALCDEPSAYLDRYDEEVKVSDEVWKERLRHEEDQRFFGLFVGEALIGLTGIWIHEGIDPSARTAMMGRNFIDSAFRGLGLSAHLFDACISWAKKHSTCERIIVCHRDGNAASKHTILKNGFTECGRQSAVWGDGETANGVIYVLELAPKPPQGSTGAQK